MIRAFIAAACTLLGAAILSLPPSGPSRAQQDSGSAGLADVANPDRDKPLEITADNTLEWHREVRQFIARGNALAVQGTTSVRGDVLTADYRDGPDGKTEIWRVTASGGVEIKSGTNTAKGDKAVYDLDRGAAVLTGRSLQMTSPEQTVTARESFEYWLAQGRLTAIGDAKLVRAQETLEADTLSAFFTDKDGKRELERIEAKGNVIITTPTEKLTGDEGIYRADTETAEVTGNVKITRGPNVLEGKKARIDLKTKVSSLIGTGGAGGADGGDGRVRGVFFPESEKQNSQQNPGKAP